MFNQNFSLLLIFHLFFFFRYYYMTEKLRNQYREIIKERDLLLHEMKRIKHDYNLYVEQNDQVG